LGVLYADQGKMDEAEKIYQRALQGREKTWGPEHTSTLGTVNNLGSLYADQGKMDEAEKMYDRAELGLPTGATCVYLHVQGSNANVNYLLR